MVNALQYIETYNQNQITFIVTSPQHKCLGEWNSYKQYKHIARNIIAGSHG